MLFSDCIIQFDHVLMCLLLSVSADAQRNNGLFVSHMPHSWEFSFTVHPSMCKVFVCAKCPTLVNTVMHRSLSWIVFQFLCDNFLFH